MKVSVTFLRPLAPRTRCTRHINLRENSRCHRLTTTTVSAASHRQTSESFTFCRLNSACRPKRKKMPSHDQSVIQKHCQGLNQAITAAAVSICSCHATHNTQKHNQLMPGLILCTQLQLSESKDRPNRPVKLLHTQNRLLAHRACHG